MRIFCLSLVLFGMISCVILLVSCGDFVLITDPAQENPAPQIRVMKDPPTSIELTVTDKKSRETTFRITYLRPWCYRVERIKGDKGISFLAILNNCVDEKEEGFENPPTTIEVCFKNISPNLPVGLVWITIKAGPKKMGGEASGWIRGPGCPHDQGIGG